MDIIKLDHRLEDKDFRYGSDSAAGVDLRACNVGGYTEGGIYADITLRPLEMRKIGTGIKVDMSKSLNMCALVFPRSGLGTRGITLANTVGVIDSDYHGEIILSIKNTGFLPLIIEPLDRIAQLVFMPIFRPVFNFVTEFKSETVRGSGGFGSTGNG